MAETSSSPPKRRFLATPVETTIRRAKKENDVQTHDRSTEVKDNGKHQETAPKKRFLPTPVETFTRRSKQPGNAALPTPAATLTSMSNPRTPLPEESRKPRRPRFAPQLIETSKRSKKAGDLVPATLPTDKTDLTPGVPNIYTRSKRKAARPPANTPLDSSNTVLQILPQAPRRQGSMRPHLNTRRSTRQNSFQPELPAIPSEENSNDSDKEDVPSLTGSLTSSDDSLMRLQLSRTRESCDDRFSGYLLELAAKAAEKQLREQALAAFPNESRHEIVEHFYDREIDANSDDEYIGEYTGRLLDDMPSAIRRKSTEPGWLAKEMQAHQEMLNRQREEETNAKIAAEATKPTFKDPFWTNGMTAKSPFWKPGPFEDTSDPKKDAELRCMRSAASPPMLGDDLKFRICPSPKATKLETDQKIDVQPNRSDDGGGLWGGYCVADEAGEYITPSVKGPALIHTPYPEREDLFSAAMPSDLSPEGAKTPRTKDCGVRMLAGVNERLLNEAAKAKVEEALLMEFDDSFVTQVYNYLSLGYPALARSFDEELARISRISEEELRVEDHKKNAKGYIGIVDGFSNQETTPEKKKPNGTAPDGHCARWKALKIYILEWAKQHPSMSNGAMGPSAWGVRARRGSWAI